MTQLEEQVVSDAKVATVDMKLEVVVIPVSDVDRAKEFYGRLGWRLDADFRFDNGFRVVQFTPPAPGPPYSSARRLRRLLLARHKACTWSSPTSWLPATSSSPAASTSAKCFTRGAPGANFQPDGSSTRLSGPVAGSHQLPLLRHVQRPGR